MPTSRRVAYVWLLAAATTFAGTGVAAQDYPNRPIRLIVPFAAGGGSDVMARLIAEPLAKRLGQPVVVENKPGANATIGAELVVKSPADGYTLLYTPPGPQITNPSLMAKLPYDPVKDLVPVARLGVFVSVLAVNPRVPASTVKELIAYARANPRTLNFSSPGIGSANHLAGEYFARLAGIEIVHVPYKGSGPAMQDLIAGNVQMTFDTLAALQPHLRSGALRALAIAGLERSPSLPGVPALAEDVAGFDASPLSYVSVRAGTPPAIVARLNREVNAVLSIPELRARLADLGIAVAPGTAEDIARQVASEREKWKKVIDASGARLE